MATLPAPALNDDADDADAPRPSSRVRLDSVDRVRRELVRLYKEGRDNKRDTQDVSRHANLLALIGRLIEGGQLEARIAALEAPRQQR
jgi:hypothetical protein